MAYYNITKTVRYRVYTAVSVFHLLFLDRAREWVTAVLYKVASVLLSSYSSSSRAHETRNHLVKRVFVMKAMTINYQVTIGHSGSRWP